MHRALRTTAVFLALAAIVIPVSSCQQLNDLTGSLLKAAPKPSADFKSLKIKDIRMDGIDMVAVVDVTNPYPVPLTADSVGFELLSKQQGILKGSTAKGLRVGASKTEPVEMDVTLPFKDAFAVLKDIRPGQVLPLTTKLDLSLVGESVSPLNFKMERDNEVPIPTVPEVGVDNIKWNQLSLDGADGELSLRIKNTNEFPLDLNELVYSLNMGGTDLAKGLVGGGAATKFAPGQELVIPVKVSVKPKDLGLSALKMLTSKTSKYQFAGNMDVTSPFGPIKMDFARKGEAAQSKK